MKKKGFTLIELLAVIVILAIIALIAIPLVLNTIEEARKGAAKVSALSYIEAVEKYIVLSKMDSSKPQLQVGVEYQLSSEYYEIASLAVPEETFINDLVNFKGEKPSAGVLTITENGSVGVLDMEMNNYSIYCLGEECVVSKIQGVQSISINENVRELPLENTLQLTLTTVPDKVDIEPIWSSSDETIATVDSNGLVTAIGVGDVTIFAKVGKKKTSIQLTVKELLCTRLSGTKGIYTYGDKFSCDPGDGTRRIFYVLEDGDNTTLVKGSTGSAGPNEVSLIMNSNIDGTILKWSSAGNTSAKGPDTLLSYLAQTTATWTKVESYVPTAYQIAIAGNETSWTVSNCNYKQLPEWLYEGLSSGYGYWTTTPQVDSNAWSIAYYSSRGYGIMSSSNIWYGNSGIRPVITVSKVEMAA